MSVKETKNRILRAAIEVFARDGFSGANVADIAEKAQANVALIYRYFGNKEGLLEAMIDAFIEAGRSQQEKKESLPSTPGEFSEMGRWGWEYLMRQKDMVRIVLSEALKGEVIGKKLFDLLDASVINRLPPELSQRPDDETMYLAVVSFFFGLAPFVMAISLGEKWAAHYGYSPDTMRALFLRGFDEVYADYVLKEFVPGHPQEE